MSLYSNIVNPEIQKYINDKTLTEHDVLRRIRFENTAHPESHMQIAPEQAQFMTNLMRMISPQLVLELGTYFGYSAISLALGMPNGSKLWAFEIDAEFAEKAIAYCSDAGLSEKIEVKIGSALSGLQNLIAAGYENKIDFIFIDADKDNYDEYYELSLKLIRVGGIIAIDNVLWYGRILDINDKSKLTKIINDLNEKIGKDARVFASIVPIGDGMTLAIKK